jgi:hypothetical protein
MAKKILESFALFERTLPAINGLPEVIMPKRHYYHEEIARGKRPIIELNEQQWARVQADAGTMSMIERGMKEGYRLVDRVPAAYKTKAHEVAELRAENAQLRAENAQLKAGTAPAVEPDVNVSVVETVQQMDLELSTPPTEDLAAEAQG